MSERLFNWLTSRGAGVLLHPTSLPGPTGIGTLGRFAFRFVDFLADTGMKYWQVCPLGPTGFGDSPYQCFSAFAGNPYLVDLEELVHDGFLEGGDIEPLATLSERAVDYGAQWEIRWLILRRAFDGFRLKASSDQQAVFARFRQTNSEWLEAYCLFMALKSRFNSRSWLEWPSDFRHHAMAKQLLPSKELEDQVSAYAFYQFKFFQQWDNLRRYAADRKIQIFGDIPIFVAMDSADVWTHPELFQMTEDLRPTGVAGVPPDYFAADGQLWGNPLYAWERHAKDGYAWWLARLRASFVAEDLGVITESVRRLVNQAGLPGMKILQFAFEGATEYLPHNCVPDSVLYPGTHDNDTCRGWLTIQPPNVKDFVQRYLRAKTKIVWEIIRAGYASASRIFIVPMQDLLNLGSEARMNIPGTPSGNWRWRFTSDQLDGLGKDRGEELREYARLYGR